MDAVRSKKITDELVQKLVRRLSTNILPKSSYDYLHQTLFGSFRHPKMRAGKISDVRWTRFIKHLNKDVIDETLINFTSNKNNKEFRFSYDKFEVFWDGQTDLTRVPINISNIVGTFAKNDIWIRQRMCPLMLGQHAIQRYFQRQRSAHEKYFNASSFEIMMYFGGCLTFCLGTGDENRNFVIPLDKGLLLGEADLCLEKACGYDMPLHNRFDLNPHHPDYSFTYGTARTYIGPMEMRPEQVQLRMVMLDMWEKYQEEIKQMYYYNIFCRETEDDKIRTFWPVKELVQSSLWQNTVKRL